MEENDVSAQALWDIELVAGLRRVATEIDSVPDEVLAGARAAITTRDLDSQLAALVADSAADEATDPRSESTPLTGAFEAVRAGPGGLGSRRVLSFAGTGIHVDLEVTERGGLLDLVGILTGASAEDCALEYAAGGQHALEVDGLGRFLATGVRGGLVRARCRSAAGNRVVTAWVRI